MIELLLFTGILLGFGLLGFGTHSLIYDGFRYAIPWFVAWFIIHGCTFVGILLNQEKYSMSLQLLWLILFGCLLLYLL